MGFFGDFAEIRAEKWSCGTLKLPQLQQ